MSVALSGIFALGTGSHAHVEFDLQAESDPLTLVQRIANLEEPRMTTGEVNLVVGFRPSLWARVAPLEAPTDVRDFEQDVEGSTAITCPPLSMICGSGRQGMPNISSSASRGSVQL
jgi:porphyrinogen peroxidase